MTPAAAQLDDPRPPRNSPQPTPWDVIGIALALIVGSAVLLAIGGIAASRALDDEPAAVSAVAGQVGLPARDGDLELTVTDHACGSKTVGDGLMPATARGAYCVVTLQVRNVGLRPQPFDEAGQKGYDQAGAAYTHDALAEYEANSARHSWFQQIDPGRQVTGKLVFDLPEPASLASIELHATPTSPGVRVPLA
jgi:hypothetical protein